VQTAERTAAVAPATCAAKGDAPPIIANMPACCALAIAAMTSFCLDSMTEIMLLNFFVVHDYFVYREIPFSPQHWASQHLLSAKH
jgi:hypothetical protein